MAFAFWTAIALVLAPLFYILLMPVLDRYGWHIEDHPRVAVALFTPLMLCFALVLLEQARDRILGWWVNRRRSKTQ